MYNIIYVLLHFVRIYIYIYTLNALQGSQAPRSRKRPPETSNYFIHMIICITLSLHYFNSMHCYIMSTNIANITASI